MERETSTSIRTILWLGRREKGWEKPSGAVSEVPVRIWRELGKAQVRAAGGLRRRLLDRLGPDHFDHDRFLGVEIEARAGHEANLGVERGLESRCGAPGFRGGEVGAEGILDLFFFRRDFLGENTVENRATIGDEMMTVLDLASDEASVWCSAVDEGVDRVDHGLGAGFVDNDAGAI